jgi:type II secretory pathway component PulK
MRVRLKNRNGSVLVVVLVCLGFAVTVMMGAARSSIQQRRQMRNERDLQQTQWLLDAGIRLAIEKSKENPHYDGQTLKVSRGLKSGQTGTVKIEIEKHETDHKASVIQVSATLQRPKNQFAIKRSHHFVLSSNKRESQPDENRDE